LRFLSTLRKLEVVGSPATRNITLTCDLLTSFKKKS
jgi:hypothetical protein